jgi:sugar fermentation stimulation protein A
VRYQTVVSGRFLRRPNRFIAHVETAEGEQIVHVKNTGRCRELLVPGCTVYLERSDNPDRKTAFDLIAVEKGTRIINMDSQAPNAAAGEWLRAGGLGPITELRAESFYEDSRFDFSFTLDDRRCYLEVKGVTLENDGVCAFPDAPTLRGAKHLRGLIRAAEEGYGAYVLFVIQMGDVVYLHPNEVTDPAFGDALRSAAAVGVTVMAMDCHVTPDTMELRRRVEVRLNAPEATE